MGVVSIEFSENASERKPSTNCYSVGHKFVLPACKYAMITPDKGRNHINEMYLADCYLHSPLPRPPNRIAF